MHQLQRRLAYLTEIRYLCKSMSQKQPGMKQFVAALSIIASISPLSAATLRWYDTTRPVISLAAPSASGLNEICVAGNAAGITAVFIPDSGNPAGVGWYRYSSMGGGYAEQVASAVSGTGSVHTVTEGDMGFIIEDGTDRYYFWLVDYSRHPFAVTSITESAEQDCGRVALDVAGTGDEIAYYSITGRRMVLSREIELAYNTLVWDDAQESYIETPVSESLESLHPVIHADAPLCATDFTISGDRFMREWGEGISLTSASFQPRSVACHTSAVQTEREADNEVKQQTGSLGGSAPCEIEFKAAVTDGALFREWQFSHYSDFEDIYLRASELEFTHTFTEQGASYVRFYCANADASCDAYGETYEIGIGASSLKCPNAFSPFNEDGVNDIWKVSYSSIVTFECSIFNRNGRRIISFSNPADGWDGRYGGKFVPAGVYYYVIKARGADGVEYNLSGDINIVDYK